MKKTVFILLLILSQQANASKGFNVLKDTLPSMLKGHFIDDYGIEYIINDTLWTQLPNIKYHIVNHNAKAKYLLARNDSKNPSEAGLYTRIDYMDFANMSPFDWGFCLTVYNARSFSKAKRTASADRQNPKKGCGGYPFSRMMRKDL